MQDLLKQTCENSACGKLFTLNKYAGKNTELIFNFSITANGGKNIFWSILREGSKTPLFSGNSLQTVNGVLLM
jgi:hypothetical protein